MDILIRKERKEKQDARAQLLKHLALATKSDEGLTKAQLERRIRRVRHETVRDLIEDCKKSGVIYVVKTERTPAGKKSEYYKLTDKGLYYAAFWNPELEDYVFSKIGNMYRTMRENRKQKMLSAFDECAKAMRDRIESGKTFSSIGMEISPDKNGIILFRAWSVPRGLENFKGPKSSKGRKSSLNELHELLKNGPIRANGPPHALSAQ